MTSLRLFIIACPVNSRGEPWRYTRHGGAANEALHRYGQARN